MNLPPREASWLSSALRMTLGLAFLAFGVFLFFCVCLVLLPSRRLRILACNLFGHTIGRAMLWFIGATPPAHVQQLLHNVRPALYLSNHTSIIDIFVGMWISPYGTCGVAKKEVVFYPFLGLLYLISGHLRVDRDNRQNAIRSMDAMVKVVRRHQLSIWIWPEGTRSHDGKLLPFKKGFAHLALATRLPIVPVVIHGAAAGWRKRSLRLTPVTLRIEVLDAIPTTHWDAARLDEHIEHVHAHFRAALAAPQSPPVQAQVSV